jgi:hypothetical protein
MHGTLAPEAKTATTLGWIDRETDAMAASLRPSKSFLCDPEDDRCFQNFRQCMLTWIDNSTAFVSHGSH